MIPQSKATSYLKIMPITPVHIGNGEEMSPFSDYIYHDGYIYFINPHKLNLLDKKERELLIQNNYKVARPSENEVRKQHTLKAFLGNSGKEWREFVFSETKIPCLTELKTEKIKRCIKTNNVPYIPGSTLKGAIRTAIDYDFYKNNVKGKKIIDKIVSALEKNIKNEDFKKLLYKSFKNENDYGEYIRIVDSHPNSNPKALIITSLRREQMAINCECLNDGSEFYTKLAIQPFKLGIRINNFSQLLLMIKQFSLDNLKRELAQAKKINHKLLIERLEELITRINKNDEALIRIGQQKTFFYNTFLNLLCPEVFEKYKKIMKIGKKTKRGDNNEFPVTKSIIIKENYEQVDLAGWCKIETVNEEEFKSATHGK